MYNNYICLLLFLTCYIDLSVLIFKYDVIVSIFIAPILRKSDLAYSLGIIEAGFKTQSKCPTYKHKQIWNGIHLVLSIFVHILQQYGKN